MKGVQWICPTWHPAYILRQNARFRGVLQYDLDRAFKQLGSPSRWVDKNYIFKPTPAIVENFLNSSSGRVSVDIETDGEHPLICAVRCIGLWNGRQGLCIPLLYRDGSYEEIIVPGKKKPERRAIWKKFYSTGDEARVLNALGKFYQRVDVIIVGQNFKFDRLCQRIRLGLPISPTYRDTMLKHHVQLSCFPHGLDFLASMYTCINYYKKTEEGKAWSSESDDELAIYCLRDCVVTYIADSELDAGIERPEDRALLAFDHRMAVECEKWQETGILIDREALALFQAYYRGLRDKALEAMRKLVAQILSDRGNEYLEQLTTLIGAQDADDDGALFKPGSLPQLRNLCRGINIPLLHETDTGQLSTAKEYLLEARTLMIEKGAKPGDKRLEFLTLLFAWREAQKIESTYLHPEILPDGRVHPNYNVHVTPTGRLSSDGPNFQNQPPEIRGMYVAPEGYRLVAGDWDAGELRLIAYLSNERFLQEGFKNFDAGAGPKIHKLNCCAIFNIPMEQITDPLYRAAKMTIYALNYGSSKPTIYNKLRLEMPDLTFETFSACYDNLKRKMPRIFEWQDEIVREAIRAKHMDSPFLSRRAYFLEPAWGNQSTEVNKMLNFPLQSGIADQVGIANFRILDTVFPKYEKQLRSRETLRQLTQVHDELLFEVPKRFTESFERDFKSTAEIPPPGHPTCRLPVEVHSSVRWKPIPLDVMKWAAEHRPELLTTRLRKEYEDAVKVEVEVKRAEQAKKAEKMNTAEKSATAKPTKAKAKPRPAA